MGESRTKHIARHEDLKRIKYKTKDGKAFGVRTVRMLPIADCPLCMNGTIVNPLRQRQDDRCALCQGTGKVSLEVCRGCGRPATTFKFKVLFCGRAKCFEALTPTVSKIYSSSSAGTYTPQSTPRSLMRDDDMLRWGDLDWTGMG